VHHFAEVQKQPEKVWWVVTAIGLATAALLWVYDRVVKPGEEATST
jgi:proton-dependent oligopeptide transporter, POT family